MPISKTDLIYRDDGSIYHLGLQPEQMPDVIFAVGDPERVSTVSQYFDAVETKVTHREFVSHIGRIGTRQLMVISSGMGADNVEILMTELDALVNIDRETRQPKNNLRSLTIIRLGTSGALQPEVALDSILLSQAAFGLDTLMQFYPYTTLASFQQATVQLKSVLNLEFTPYVAEADSELMGLFQSKFQVGNTVTCPGFYAPQGRQLRLASRQNCFLEKLINIQFTSGQLSNLEMETAGYYALGRLLGHRMLSVNAILAHRATGEFSLNPQKTIQSMIEQVLAKVDEC
ncbi:nucleoside phosphorylase [Tunicatimonas pelagia]|uniref:nucleoside phosphorylase n=1 Tax=Tunicatimonas pelagia TaxID=931531 RepID=UPI0026667A37|nr:nucleoside phosphorylase [Tunicatimonas pelagia]WKN44351.1 nucleoside phosphorylase [Tunicatimonas pelagia]